MRGFMRGRAKTISTFIILLFLLASSVFIALSLGAVSVSPLDILRGLDNDVLTLRLSRIILGAVVGAALSVAGCVLQGLLRNPLAEPYVLGISGGAGLGAVIAIALGAGGTFLGIAYLPVSAFIGAIITMALVYSLAKMGGKIPVQGLVLAGIIVGSVFSSILLFLVSLSQEQAARDAIWWLLGNLQVYDTRLLAVVSAISVAGIIAAMFFSRELNIISLGEEEAAHMGVNIEALKKMLFAVAGLITASSVSASGIIGFVGLIVPHILRLWLGPDHRALIPASALFGASFLVICDTFARTVMPPAEIPIGAVTAVIGGPFFIFLLRTRRRIAFK
jgi:iron complex transport system permease protein